MSPSSLIFVIVVAVWAVYLTLHVIRRREHLATARNVDRFSGHMRVLQRRAVRNAPRTRLKSSVNLVRAAERRVTDVLTQRVDGAAQQAPATARNMGQAGTVHPTATRPRSATVGGLAGVADTPDPWAADVVPAQSPAPDETGWVARSDVGQLDPTPAPVTVPTDVASVSPAAVRISWPFAVLAGLAGLPARTVRTMALLGCLALALLAGTVGIVTQTGWIVLVGVLPLAGVGVWLPRSAQAERAARNRSVLARRHTRARTLVAQAAAEAAAAGRSGVSWEELPGRSRVPTMPVAQEHVDLDEQTRVSASATLPPVAADPATGTGRAAVRRPRRNGSRRSEPFDLLTDDPTWSPVPVPPPTYTLKARAEHPVPAPMSAPVPVPIEVEDDFDSWAHPAPRRKKAVNS